MNFKQDDKALHLAEKALEKDLIKQYKTSLKSIQAELGVFFTKYASGDSMTHADATKFNRLAKLEKEIARELSVLTATNKKTITNGLTNLYDETYFRAAFQFEKGVQAKLGYTTLNQKAVIAAIQNPISGLTLNERLAKNKADIIIGIKQDLTQGIIRGDSYQSISRTLQDRLEKDAAKATRVVQTEGNRIINAARNEATEHAMEVGVKGRKIWVSSLDDSTRDNHGELDGKAADEDGLFYISGGSAAHPGDFGIAEEDINCRCTTRFEIEGFEPTVRRIQGEGVVPYKNYEEWKTAKDAD